MEKEQSKEEPSMVKVSDKSKAQPLEVLSHSQIKVILTTDLKRETTKDISAKTVERSNAQISKPKKEYKSPMSSKSVVADAIKRIKTVKENLMISDAKKRKIEDVTQPLSTDKWIGANDILRRILIADAKKKTSLSTNTEPPLHETSSISTKNTSSSRMSVPTIITPVQVSSTTSNPENSLKGNSKDSITSTTTAKRFRYEDLYGVSDDSE